MSALDVESLLQPFSDDSPSGDDLEYDPQFQEMERTGQGKPEHVMGDSVVPAEEPDWKAVAAQAQELLARSKDLRAAALLTRSLTHSDGLPGLRDGLRLINSLLEQFWETVHPRLDAEDNDDPTMRVNALVALADPELLQMVSNAPMVRSAALGVFSLRDYKFASGELPIPETEEAPPDMSMINGAFMDSDAGDVEFTAEAVREAIDCVTAIEMTLSQKVDPGRLPDLTKLPQMLREIKTVFAERAGSSEETNGEAAEELQEATGGEAADTVAPKPRAAGEINSREDVVRMLDKASDYYRRNEPASPVPLLLQRAKRLVTMDFMEVMQDIAPDGADQAAKVCGVQLEE